MGEDAPVIAEAIWPTASRPGLARCEESGVTVAKAPPRQCPSSF